MKRYNTPSSKIILSTIIIVFYFSIILQIPIINAVTELKLYPIADSYVSSINPNTNYGGTSNLDIVKSTNMFVGNKIAFIKFDLSTIPSGAIILEATLNLYTSFIVSQTFQIQRHYCRDNTWQELSITWNNKPSYETPSGFWTISKASEWYGLIINSKSYEEEWNFVDMALKNSDKKMTIVLSSITESVDMFFGFLSKDQTYSWMEIYKPFLTIQYSIPLQSSISCLLSKNRIVQGESITISGSIRPVVFSQTVKLIYTDPYGNVINRNVQSNTNGDYTDYLTPDKVGLWSCKASWEGNADYQGAISSQATFTVAEPPKRGSLKILVRDEKGNPISGATITSIAQPIEQTSLIGYSGSDGTYTFNNVIVGSYNLKVTKSEYNDNSIQLTVNAEQTTSQTIQLNKLISSIKIFVKDSNANPLVGATVTSTSQPTGQSTLSGSTGNDGSITFNDIKTGAYTIMVSKSGLKSKSESLSTSLGEKTEKTIILEPEQQPSGGIPGYPIESIFIGILLTIGFLLMYRRLSEKNPKLGL